MLYTIGPDSVKPHAADHLGFENDIFKTIKEHFELLPETLVSSSFVDVFTKISGEVIDRQFMFHASSVENPRNSLESECLYGLTFLSCLIHTSFEPGFFRYGYHQNSTGFFYWFVEVKPQGAHRGRIQSANSWASTLSSLYQVAT